MRFQPWSPALATQNINRIGTDDRLKITYTNHAKERLIERDLTTGDLLYVLSHGFVYAEAKSSTQDGLYKYEIETRTPNSQCLTQKDLQ